MGIITKETRAKISKALTGKHLTDEHRANLRLGKLRYYASLSSEERSLKHGKHLFGTHTTLGYKFTDKQRLNVKLAHIGLRQTAEQRQKASQTMKQYWTLHPEAKVRLGQITKQRYEDPMTRKEQSIKSKQRYANPEARKLQSNRAKEVLAKRPELIENHQRIMRERHYSRPEYRAKISEQTKGNKNPFYGKTHSAEAKKKMSQIRKTKIGVLSSRWEGGLSFEPYSPEFNSAFKESIRERDNCTCQLCGILETECFGDLSVHHIDYNKEHTVPENCIALCRPCNIKANSNRQFWQDYFTSLMNSRGLNNEQENN